MLTLTLPMGGITLNESLQLGDKIYYSPQSNVVDGGFATEFSQTSGTVYELGVLVSMSPQPVVLYDDTIIGCEQFGKYDQVRLGLDWFAEFNPKAYMVLLD